MDLICTMQYVLLMASFQDRFNRIISKNGIKAVIQPGGSVADQDDDACNDANIAMVITGARHFRH